MILHRFCSSEEHDKLISGEVLVNRTNHAVERNRNTNSVGFCFFEEDPEKAKHWLSGVVDFDYCLTLDIPEQMVTECWGIYGNRELTGSERHREYCLEEYSLHDCVLIEASTRFRSYAPNHRVLKKIFPSSF